MKKIIRNLIAGIILGLYILSSSSDALALGRNKKKKKTGEPAARQAFPRRVLEFKEFTTSPFRLPNGQQADMGQDVRLLVDTQVNRSAKFSTNNGSPFMDRHGVLSGGISSLVFDIASVGVKFGYRNGSDLSSSSNGGQWGGAGNVKVNIGLIGMDFKIYDSETGEAYAAVSVDQNMAGVDLGFDIDFNGINAGADFLWKTPLKNVIQNLAAKAMKNLASQFRANFIPWETLVLGVDLSRNLILFDAGVRADIHPGDVFWVYRACKTPDCFEAYIADLKVLNVLEYSEAKISSPGANSIKSIEVNDKVYIKPLAP